MAQCKCKFVSYSRSHLPGDCIGGLAELKRLDKSGFLAECLCPHEYDLVVVGAGGGAKGRRNELAEYAVEVGKGKGI